MKNVTSKDPRKPMIVTKFKVRTGAVKVTLVQEQSEGVFRAHCMERVPHSKSFASMGYFILDEKRDEVYPEAFVGGEEVIS